MLALKLIELWAVPDAQRDANWRKEWDVTKAALIFEFGSEDEAWKAMRTVAKGA